MRRWYFLIVAVAIAAVGFVDAHFRAERQRAEQEANYQAVVASYSREFTLGMTRAEVEDRLNARGVSIGQTTTGKDGDGLADLIRIGEVKDDVPWYCSRLGVYVELIFSSVSNKPWDPSPEDTLKRVKHTDILESCL